MKIGVTIGGPLAGIGPAAAHIEGLGFDSVWTAETGSTAFVQAALAAQSTSRVRIGTAIALAFPRSPGITAMTAVDIDELSGGRFLLGLGSQVKRVNEERFSTHFDHPAPRMREYAEAVRAFIGGYFGDEPAMQGRFYRVTMAPWARIPPPLRRDIPIYFAAVNKMMLRAAGAVADGVVGHPMTSVEYIRQQVLPNIERGAKKAGRSASDVELAQQVIVSVAEDRSIALEEVKQQIGFYATTRTYAPVLATHGFEEIIPRLREAYSEKDMKKLASLVSPEMAKTFALFGEPDEVREQARRFDGLIGELVLGGPWYRVDPTRVADNYRLMMEAFSQR